MNFSVKQIPNIITTCRFLLVPVFAYLLIQGDVFEAGIVFAIAAASDMLDGFLARRLNAISEWGRVVDPMADHSLTNAAVIIMALKGILPMWALLFLLKEVFLFCMYMLLRKKIKVYVTWLGKLAALLIMSSIALLLIFDWQWAVGLFLAGIVVSLAAAVEYIIQARRSYISKTAISG